jgi:hypothetical protein
MPETDKDIAERSKKHEIDESARSGFNCEAKLVGKLWLGWETQYRMLEGLRAQDLKRNHSRLELSQSID